MLYYAKLTLDVPGETATAVLKGEAVDVTAVFEDTDGVRCADAIVNRRRLTIPMEYLQPQPDPDRPPSDALEATGGISHGVYGAPADYSPGRG